MQEKVILATRNPGKVKEMRSILADFGLEVVSLDDIRDVPHVEEDGETFYENALKKARVIAKATGIMALADDSGLEVDYLDGAPGVYSARYSGEHATDKSNNSKLLSDLQGVPSGKRNARFRCVMVLFHPSGRWISAEGACEGEIAQSPAGEYGFGYDPVFFIPSLGKTMAQLTREEKNSLSHRGEALSRLKELLPDFLDSIQ
ncbi:MAG TPA: XTP/dITP diphosphatase [Thermodesulfobacteriaceae bacterium]|nr:XTP/dITP diphosphatase [Thermodesulfobacteriaceae bacterium]